MPLKAILGPLQILLLPATTGIFLWGLYRLFFKKDKAAGLVLILGVTLIIDQWMLKAIFIPGLRYGSIRFSELLIGYMLVFRPGEIHQPLKTKNLYLQRITMLFVIYLIFYFIAALRAYTPVDSIFSEFRFVALTPFLVFLIASRGLATEEEYNRFCLYLMILASIISIASMQMILFDKYFIDSPSMEDKFYHTIARHRRFGSFFGNPNHLGGFLVLVLPVFTILLLTVKQRWVKILVLVGLLLNSFILIKTYSRGSFLGLAFAGFLFLFFKIKGLSLAKKVAGVVIVLVGIFVFAPNIYKSVYNRLNTIEKESIYGDHSIVFVDDEDVKQSHSRVFLWVNSLKIISTEPLFGIGLSFVNYRAKLVKNIGQSIDRSAALALIAAEHPHNSYLYIALFLGNIALIFFMLMIFYFYKGCWIFLKNTNNLNMRLLNFAVMSGISGYLFLNSFDFQLFVKGSCSPFWVLFGYNISQLNSLEKD